MAAQQNKNEDVIDLVPREGDGCIEYLDPNTGEVCVTVRGTGAATAVMPR